MQIPHYLFVTKSVNECFQSLQIVLFAWVSKQQFWISSFTVFYPIGVRAHSTEYILPYPQIISNIYINSARPIHAVYCQDRLPKRKNIFLLQLHKQRLGLIICVSEWHPASATILANLCFLWECNVAIDWNVLQSSFPLQKIIAAIKRQIKSLWHILSSVISALGNT